jgi:hypothetical protein
MKEMDCCSESALMETPADMVQILASDERQTCTGCGGKSRPVTRKTVFLMLKPQCFNCMGESEYRFCPSPECPVVYFAEDGDTRFTTDELRVRVGLKETEDPVPLCYCFGFDEQDAREEIRATGQCSIPQRISALIRRGMCACVERNPSGKCCLGEVNIAVQRLISEAIESAQPVQSG